MARRSVLWGAVVVVVLATLASQSVANDQPCYSKWWQNPNTCTRRPHFIVLGASSAMHSIRWRDWGGGRVVGFGRYTFPVYEPKRHQETARAKIVLAGVQRCRGHSWYTYFRVRYGPGYRRLGPHGGGFGPC